MEFPPEIIDPIREMCGAAKLEAQRLKTEASESAQAVKIWCDFMRYIENDWPVHLLTLVDKEASRLKKMRSENHSVISSIEEVYRIAKEEKSRILRRFPSLLEEGCRDSGLTLDSDSRHPKYSFQRGFFRLEIDEKKHTARLFNHEGRLAELPADVQAVIEALQKEHKRIFGRDFNGPKFLKSLRTQYKAIIKKEKQPDGSSIPIRHITRRLGKNVKGFRTDEFLVNLSRLAQEGPLEIDGRRIDLQQTKDTNQGMLLYGPAGQGYIGFILFKEV